MQLLILGGTAWLGRQIAATALERGHSVTCVARAVSGQPPAGATLAQVDRDRPDAFDAVADRRWDAVVDVTRHPGQVRRAAEALAAVCARYVFVSSASVYARHDALEQDESAALLPALQAETMTGMETYGQAKVACEQHLLRTLGAERALLVRAGLIGGPGDASDRSGYWPWRFAHAAAQGRRVLVPDAPAQPTQLIDVRDLAAWIVHAAGRGLAGAFNAVGEVLPLGDHLQCARAVAAHDGPIVAASSGWLQQQGVAPWAGPRSLPLWLPMADHAGFSTRSSSAALAAGLQRRPLQETLRDTLAWQQGRDAAAVRKSGLSDADEDALLARLDAEALPR